MKAPPVDLRTALRNLLRPIYRPLKLALRFMLWAVPGVARLLAPTRPKDRVLIVYDTSSQPFSVGDVLIFQEASLVLCELHGIEVVDFAVLYDPANPASSSPVFSGSVNQENTFYHLASILPVAQVNQHLGSVFVFDSRAHLERFVGDNVDRYEIWPSGAQVSTREYLSPVVFNRLLRRHHREHGSIPHLTCRPFLKRWAEAFFDEHVRPRVPITVNLRNNPHWGVNRNSDMESWIGFFDHCASRYAAVFVVICARSEIDSRLRGRSNVLVAKDHDTGIEQDLALVDGSAAHMGASSGPATMAWFNDKPYLMVNTVFRVGEFFSHPDLIQEVEEGIQRVWFAQPSQRVANSVETVDLLVREFARLWQAIDADAWRRTDDAPDRSRTGVQSWLR